MPSKTSPRERRLRNLHLHDNDGRPDQHGLPGDGMTDWAPSMRSLRNCAYEGPPPVGVTAESGPEVRLARCREGVAMLKALPEEGFR